MIKYGSSGGVSLDNRVNELRKQLGKTMKELSVEIGIGLSTISNYENGYSTPKKQNAQKLADYFGVSVPYLLGLDDNPNLTTSQSLDVLEKITILHEVLQAGDNVLAAQELLKNALETLVNYAGNDYGVEFESHILIANTLSDAISKLDILLETDELYFTPDKLTLFDN
ncbi:helix-turn-helix domain-containing protein [Streptococcus gallolyticus]|nr:helix-turn-helix transcriptional regulator [Streptococcus gallolyticus]